MEQHDDARPQREIIYVPASGYGCDNADEIDLLDLWEIVWRGKWFIVGFTLLCTVLGFVYAFGVATPQYRARATLKPTKQSQDVIVNHLNSNKFHRKLIKNYDLLPKMYPDLWDAENHTWLVESQADIPTVDKALAAEGKFNLKVELKEGLINITWEGSHPEYIVTTLENIIHELNSYLKDDFESEAQAQMKIIYEELGPWTENFEQVWEQFWSLDKLTVANMEVLNQYTRLKNQISNLKVQDAMARKFEVQNDPIEPQHPFEPNKKLIVALSCVLGLFISVFLVFFGRFIHNARERAAEKQAK